MKKKPLKYEVERVLLIEPNKRFFIDDVVEIETTKGEKVIGRISQINDYTQSYPPTRWLVIDLSTYQHLEVKSVDLNEIHSIKFHIED